MRIRRSAASSVSPSPALSPSPSSCSSSSSCFSSHSTISTHSLTSSSNSTSSSSSPSAARRCHGLDLLVKAVYYVAGSVVGVPYIQRRVIRRRKPALKFTNFLINSDHLDVGLVVDGGDDDDVIDCSSNFLEKPPQPLPPPQQLQLKKKKNNNKTLKRRSKAVPLKFNDSVLQSWKPRDRRRRRSSKA